MTKQEIEPFVGKFVNISFTYKHKRAPEPKFIDAYGHIIRLEDKNLLFKDNDNYQYIVDLNKIWHLSPEGKRRTARQYQKLLQIQEEAKKKQKELMKTTRL